MATTLTSVTDKIKKSPLLRKLMILSWHSIGIFLTYMGAFGIRFEGSIPLHYWVIFWQTLPILLVVDLLVFAVFRLHSGMWSFFSIDDVARMGLALLAATCAFACVILSVRGIMTIGFPRSIFFVEFMLMGIWMTGGRFVTRYLREHKSLGSQPNGGNGERVLIVGRLHDADILMRSYKSSGTAKFVGIVTDDATERNLTLHGIRIRGLVRDICRTAMETRANCILILPPFNRPADINRIVADCSKLEHPVVFRIIPSLAELASGQLTASSIRKVDIEDLISRGTARLDRTEVRRFVKHKKVMVTGAGGSIGTELCRQLAAYEPALLVLFEFSEFALYSIEQELRLSHPGLKLIPYSGDIRHIEEIEDAIDRAGGIDIIYHAAAYKHVPLMEENVPACFRTNVLGTARLAAVAARREVDRFVLISSDKAVRPTSIMGATKRLAERIIGEIPECMTTFVSVRFGNVLESSGSVVPLFKRQIARGGPLTVTTPDVRRFFMTISEAVDLVLLAGTVGSNGDIMVLEMGECIKVVDLARRLIELSGLVPERDIKIEFTGLRPGEKEYEEVMTEDENVVRTSHERIWVLGGNGNGKPGTKPDLAAIENLVLKNDTDSLRRIARECVPENRFAWNRK